MTSIKWLLLLGTAAAAACTSDSAVPRRDRKSTRLNSSHGYISYAVFCLKKKKKAASHADGPFHRGRGSTPGGRARGWRRRGVERIGPRSEHTIAVNACSGYRETRRMRVR